MSTSALVRCRLDGAFLPVLALSGTEQLSQSFCFNVTLDRTNAYLDVMSLTQKTAQLIFQNEQGDQRLLSGNITRVDADEGTLDIELRPNLERGKTVKSSRLFMNKTRQQIVQQILEELGYQRDQIIWHGPFDNTDIPPPLLQANETHFNFVQRLLGELGCFYWFDCDGRDEQICIANDFARTQYTSNILSAEQQTKAALYGQDSPLRAKVTDAAPVKHFSQQQRPADIGKKPEGPSQEQFEPPLPEQAKRNAEAQSKQHQQAFIETWTLTGTWPTLIPGFSLVLPPIWRRDRGTDDMTVFKVEHQGKSYSRDNPELGMELSQTAILLRRDSQYRPEFPKMPILPMAVPARIESPSAYAYINESGQYQLRTRYSDDASERLNHASASPAVERMMPFANPNQQLATGWHFPLLDQSTVLVTCLNADPNTPCVMGFLPEQGQEGPVKRSNKHQMRIVTPGQNELTFDDQLPNILLQTFDGQIKLELNAIDGNEFITLACQHGLITLTAGARQTWLAQTNLIQKISGGKLIKVSQMAEFQTEGDVHYQAAKKQNLTAKTDVTQTSDANQNWHVKNGELKVRCETGMSISSQGSQMTKVSDGSYRLQASGNINVNSTGNGDLIIGNGTAGIRMSSDGVIKIFGKKVTFNGNSGGVTFNGNMEYETGAGNEPEDIEPLDIEEIEDIEPLVNEDEVVPQVSGLKWDDPLIEYSQTTAIQFAHKHFEPGEIAQITVYEVAGETETEICSLEHELTKDSGIEHLSWQPVDHTAAEHRFVEDAEKLPLPVTTYRFEVTIADITASDSSVLRLKKPLALTLSAEDPSTINGKATCIDGNQQKHYSSIINGDAHFGTVLVGPVAIEYQLSTDKEA